MATYERSTHVDAPLATVWDFHSRVSGLTRLTPDWLDLRVEAVRGPDGQPLGGESAGRPTTGLEAPVLEAGSVVHLSVAPGGVGPRQRWTSRIVAREEREDAAFFRDEMVDGPFPEWVHTHRFAREGDGTLMTDAIRYELPGGELGRRLSPLAGVGFEPVFAYRHHRTKQLLE